MGLSGCHFSHYRVQHGVFFAFHFCNVHRQRERTWMKRLLTRHVETVCISALVLSAVLLWLPRLKGPLDLRWDGGVYYILGASLAEGKGYRLLNEPGAIQAIQYPPLLPLFAAAHQLLAGNSDPAIVGRLLKVSFFAIFLC